MGYIALYAFASIVATIVQCLPVERAWNHQVLGRCINLTAFWYANASANIIGDILILGLPMPVIKGLNLPSAQRWGLFLVFALGGLYVLSSYYFGNFTDRRKRLHYLDPSHDDTEKGFQEHGHNLRYSQLNHLDHHRGQHGDHLCMSADDEGAFDNDVSKAVPARSVRHTRVLRRVCTATPSIFCPSEPRVEQLAPHQEQATVSEGTYLQHVWLRQRLRGTRQRSGSRRSYQQHPSEQDHQDHAGRRSGRHR